MRLPALPPAWQELADRTDITGPDHERYGPARVPVTGEPHQVVGLLLFCQEGGGTSVTCQCGDLFRWHQDAAQVKRWGEEHTKEKKKGDGVTYDCSALRKEAKSDEHR